MHITIQPISIWTKHQSTIIKPKTELNGKHTLQWLLSRKHTTRSVLWDQNQRSVEQCSGWPARVRAPAIQNTIPYQSKTNEKT